MIQYEVGIPAIRTSTLPLTLMSLAMQRPLLPDRILIADNGDTSVMVSYEVRTAVDICATVGIEVACCRRPMGVWRHLGPSRNWIMRSARTNYVILSDDDAIWEPETADRLLQGLIVTGADYAIPLLLTPNAESALAQATLPFPMDTHPQFSIPSEVKVVQLGTGGGKFSGPVAGAIWAVRRSAWEPEVMETWPGDQAGDDVALLRSRVSVIIQGARGWHLISPHQRKITAESHGGGIAG